MILYILSLILFVLLFAVGLSVIATFINDCIIKVAFWLFFR